MARTTIAALESGARSAKVETLQKLAAAMHMPMLHLQISSTTATMNLQAQQECVERFLRSPWVAAKPMTKEEIDWLRSLPAISWLDGAPSDESLFLFTEGFRRRSNA